MKPPLQLFSNGVHSVKLRVGWRPPGGRKIHPPAAFPGTQERFVGTGKRGSFFKVMPQGFGLVPFGGMSARFEDPPPGNAASVMAHDRAHLAGSTRAEQFGDIPVRDSGPRRYQLHYRQHRLHVLNPH